MRFATVDRITPARLPLELPVRLEQAPSQTSAILKLTVLLPATVALFLPFLLVGKALASNPAVWAVLQTKPSTALQLATALAFWAVLFAWPLKRLGETLAQARTIEIADGVVSITEKGLLGTRTLRTPVADYAGVIHHVRTSLSGLRHELILVHSDRERSALLAIADRFTQSEIDDVAKLLGLGEMPPKVIYGFGAQGAHAVAPTAKAA